MARRVYFSFHSEKDFWRADQVRNSNAVAPQDMEGLFDLSEYEKAKTKGDEEVNRLIREKLKDTTVTVVLIGNETKHHPYVQYAIEQSIAQKNGLLGVYINNLKDQNGQDSPRGPVPEVPKNIEFPTYNWDGKLKMFAMLIEAAGKRSDFLRSK
jgi:hypothetical protein